VRDRRGAEYLAELITNGPKGKQMCDQPRTDQAKCPAEQRAAVLETQVRSLKARLALYEPDEWGISDLLNGPQRVLSPEEVKRETARLLGVCAERGVKAVLAEVATSRELLLSLADACHKAGLISAAQYLLYLDGPMD